MIQVRREFAGKLLLISIVTSKMKALIKNAIHDYWQSSETIIKHG